MDWATLRQWKCNARNYQYQLGYPYRFNDCAHPPIARGFSLPPVKGDAWHTETCSSVQWPWLAYPAALLVLTFVFLLATIVQSACYSRKRIWKSSPLALLFHGLDTDMREKFRFVDRTEEMEQTAKGLPVRLSHEEGELRFVEPFGAKG